MKKNEISNGFASLLQTPAQELAPAKASKPKTVKAEETTTPTTEKVKGDYKTVCYSIPPALAEKMRYIAYYDRKKINAVVAEAFEKYIKSWQPSATEKPKKL